MIEKQQKNKKGNKGHVVFYQVGLKSEIYKEFFF
jgi:hypothetical protein